MSVNLTKVLQNPSITNVQVAGPNPGLQTGVFLEDSESIVWSYDGYGNVQAAAVPGMQLIQEQVLGTVKTVVTFSNIPQTFKHLMLVYSITSDSTGQDNMTLEFNGDATGTDYASSMTYISGGVAGAGAFTNPAKFGFVPGGGEYKIYGYTSSANPKTIAGTSSGGPQALNTGISSGAWASAEAITSIAVSTVNGGNMGAGSVFSLYGLN